jgi:hypothetical protein
LTDDAPTWPLLLDSSGGLASEMTPNVDMNVKNLQTHLCDETPRVVDPPFPPPAEPVALANLAALVYELLDAHSDTADLAADLSDELRWAAHLDYLRALQRIARESLALGVGAVEA